MRNELIKRAHQDVYLRHQETRGKLKLLMVIWLTLRLLFLGIDIMTSVRFAPEGSVTNIVITLVLQPIIVLFAKCIIDGGRGVAPLPLIGGALAIFNTVRTMSQFGELSLYPALIQADVYMALAVGVAQIVIMVIVLADKGNKAYAADITEVNKRVNQGMSAQPSSPDEPSGFNSK